MAFQQRLNLDDQAIEVYTQPSTLGEQPAYAQKQAYGLSDLIPLILAGIEVGHSCPKPAAIMPV